MASSSIALPLPIYLPLVYTKTAIMVKIKSKNRNSALKSINSSGICIGPCKMVNKNNGKPRAKHTSNMLLPKAF